MIETQKHIRKPLYVDAVRVTNANFDEIVAWCQGEVQEDEVPGHGTPKKYIKVRVHNPKNPRQTKAFVGDWLLYTERGYKVYTNKAFYASFDPVLPESPDEPDMVLDDALQQLQQATENAVLSEITPPTPIDPVTKPRDSMAMEEAKQMIEVEGGTVEEATPEAIAEAVNEQARTAEYPETHTIDGTPREAINLGIPEQPSAAEGKRVLTLEEQEKMDSEEIRELIQSGEVVLAQDLAA